MLGFLKEKLGNGASRLSGKTHLPARVAPVVDDLRKLGAQLPEVQRTEKVN